MAPVAQRRRRTIDEDESVQDEVARQPPKKRARPSTDHSQTEAGSETADGESRRSATPDETEGALLPDNYRRSPKNKRRATPNGDTAATHQPGSIVRVSLENFVTYSKVEFWPGPHLNMVIGPNGTGKSTLVCAICLGLGWSPKHLGRAKHISEFVKHGAKTAKIEIELQADPAKHDRNPVIRTRISRDSETAEFYIDNSKAPKKQVQTLARSFAIQVDNLCQFLPQDRVAEFATLSPVRLLEETQRAAAPEHMSQWHAELIELGKEQKAQVTSQQGLMDQIKSLEARQRAQQPDVDRLKQRSTLQTRLNMLQNAKPFPEYRVVKAEYSTVKRQLKDADREKKEIERELAPRLQAVNDKQTYLQQVDSARLQRLKLIERHENSTKAKHKRSEDSGREVEIHKSQRQVQSNTLRETKTERERVALGIRKLERDIDLAPPAFDTAAMNQRIREKVVEIRRLESDQQDTVEKLRLMREQQSQKSRRIAELEARKESMQSQLGKQTSRLQAVSKDAARGWDWVQANRDKFSGPVFGPAMIECSVKDRRWVAAVETVIGQSDLLAFTVTNMEDNRLLNEAFHGPLGVQSAVRKAPDLSEWHRRSPCSLADAQRLGINGWIIDLLDGPEEVLNMLCDNRSLDATGYTTSNLTPNQHKVLAESPIANYATPKELTTITRRREYGEHGVSTRVQGHRPPQFFVEAPVNRDAESGLNQEIRELKMDCANLDEEIQSERTSTQPAHNQLQQLKRDRDTLNKEKEAKLAAQKQFDGLPARLTAEKAKLEAVDEKITRTRADIRNYEAKADELALKHAQNVIEYVNSVEATRHLHMQAIEAEILKIEAESDLAQMKRQDQEDRQRLEQAKQDLRRLQAEKDKLHEKATDLGSQCKAVHDVATPEELAVIEEVKDLSVEQMQVEIESTTAQLEMHTGGNMNILQEFEERARKITSKYNQLGSSRESLEELKGQIDELRGKWEPELDAIISRISSAFSDNFNAISCAGEVSVYKDDEEFDKWAIQIKVKFRDSEALSILDSHRQSGGERSVSTIFYLMALQSLARAPFRVVDEINQGMDPRNERMVHSRLVSIACEARREDGGGGSQYFLITPKLLSGLEYHESMKIHCIASGEWVPSAQSSLSFGAFAKKALAIRAG